MSTYYLPVAGVLEMAATESTIRFSGHTLDKATKAKVNCVLHLFYLLSFYLIIIVVN